MPDDIEFLGNNNNDFFTWVYDPNPRGRDVIPPEDLFVWVSFRALPKSRSVIETDGTYSSSFFDANGIQFISSTTQNGKGYMTTNYTNIAGSETGEKEAFGIKNIDVTYGASLVPEVKIQFVDVRGAGLFNGYEFEDEKGLKYNSSEFSTFFRLPYPLFELSIKGFYGKAMTYCLHLRKMSADFDASIGNFVINAEFVGYTFAFLSDIMLKYVMAITSTELGASALERQNKRRLDVYPDSNEIIPLDDFVIRLGQLTRIGKDLKDNSGEYKELVTINSVLALLTRLQNNIGKPVNENITSIYGDTLPFVQLPINREQLFIRDVGLIADGSAQIHDIIVEDLEKFVKEYNDFISKNQGKYSYLNKYKIQRFDISTPALSYEINDDSADLINEEILKDGLTEKRQTITSDVLRSRLSLPENSTKAFYIINYHNIRKEVNNLISEAQEKQSELQAEVNIALNEKLGQELGFDLTIESVFNIILGNVEAYLDVVYNIALEADNPNIQEQRIGRLSAVRSDVNSGDQRIYPFPAVFDSDTGDEVWIGDIVGENNPAFPEIRFVKEVINSLVAVNTNKAKSRIRNNSANNVGQRVQGWIPVNPIDFDNNELDNLDRFSYSGNIVPNELSEIIVKRAIYAYNATGYNDGRFNNIAQTEGAFAASQIVNNVIRQVFKSFNTTEFVEQVITNSGFSNLNDISINGYNLSTNDGFLIGSVNEDGFIEDVLTQENKVLPAELNNVITSFGKDLEDTLVPTKLKDFHRKLDARGLYVVGDATDYGWNNKALKNLRKYYKNRTTNDLNRKTTANAPILSTVNDLTIFDGQINNTVDFAKTTNPQTKFVNNARETIGKNLIGGGDIGNCIFDTQYYNLSSDINKAYYFLLTIPLNNINEFFGMFKVAGVYKLSKLQLAWISAQFYRAKYIQDNGFDIFDKTIENVAVSLTLGGSNFNVFEQEFIKVKNMTAQYLPNLDDFEDSFVATMVEAYKQWVSTDYIEAIFDDRNIPRTFVGYIADYEQFNGYEPFGLTSNNPVEDYNYVGTGSFSEIQRGDAIGIYENTFYANVEILPTALQPIALDIHIDQGDHIGLIFATANRLGAAVPYDYDEVSDIWFGEGAYVGNPQNTLAVPLEYQQTTLYKEYSLYKSEIEQLVSQDYERFLNELTKTRMMRYSTTDGRDTISPNSGKIFFQEWAGRSLAILQFSKDFQNNQVKDNDYYFGNGSQFVKNGINLGVALSNAAMSSDTENWYIRVRQETEKRLLNIIPPLNNSGNGLEFFARLYCSYTENGINPNSADYGNYKFAYNNVLAGFIDIVDVMVVNHQKIVSINSDLYSQLGIKTLNEATLRAYVARWIETVKKLVTVQNNNRNSVTPPSSTSSENQEFYVEDKDIKLATYRHFKRLYDKWIGGSRNGQVHNTCTGGGGAPRDSMLIDRFHFIDRTWSYIGSRAVINPKPIMILSNNADIDLYSFIGNIMRDSNFDFHVLPSWVNYRNLDAVRDMWKPQTDVENASSGAAYLCMYMGGRSKVLDIGDKVGYVNDGFDLRSFDTDLPNGFKDREIPPYIDGLENNEKFKYNMVVFRVSYADQNQSIFKKIGVSQEEHKETAESLQALSDAFDSRGGTKRFYKGVNLYNVFALRSYKCKVTCMGNMMIHPLTYFQLDNVPFFHGAYVITKVQHSITPHYVETSFEGARVPRFIAPVVEFPTTYVNIPLGDTLFTQSELNESIVRPLQPEDPENFASDGENTSFNNVGGGVPTSSELLEAEEAANSLLQVNFENTGQVFNFYIKPDVTQESVEQDIARVYNPNSPITFSKVGLGDCYGWVKRSLNEIGVVQSPFFGIDAWTFYSGWDDTGTFHITDEQFINNLPVGWSNASMAEVIPDGSFIACYYPSTEYTFRSIDRMVTTGISESKVNNLKRLKALDTKTNNPSSNFFTYSDTTPISKQIFSLDGYKTRWKDAQISDYAKAQNGKPLPFAPVTHVAIFINGKCFHQTSRVLRTPTPSMRIVAYYPFKDKLLGKV